VRNRTLRIGQEIRTNTRKIVPTIIDDGIIINVSSAAGVSPRRYTAAYAAAKAAVIQLTRVTALEYARKNIRVNCILPGPIDTPFFSGNGLRIARDAH
jgi:3alpha(or 20beta)-hydroxysteroid dehydrogenase